MTLDLAFVLADLHQIEHSEFILTDLSLENQIRLLEFLKRFKDVEKGKIRGKGFGNASILNQSRNPSVFTNAERKTADILDSQGIYYVHEHRIRLKDGNGKTHTYKLDLFCPDYRINIEVSPDFHKTYKIVAIRDALKKRLLKKAGIRSFNVRCFSKKRKGRYICVPDIAYARKIARIIKGTQISPECLKYWIIS